MNKELRFSFGHILAFLALIFIAYVTFMGITYLTLGNFVIASIGAIVCVLLLATFLLGAQIKKGESNRTKFYKSMKWERALLFASPLVLLLAFYPYNHFWTVLDRDEEIAQDFNTSITQAHGIFDEYEAYANQRMEKLTTSLNKQKVNVQNRKDELQLLLLSSNYQNLKDDANAWIDNTSNEMNVLGAFSVNKASVWNVFLFGNLDNISDAIDKWTKQLHSFSNKVLSTESKKVTPFETECEAKLNCIKGLNALKEKYSTIGFRFNWIAVLTMLICLAMLLCPYFIQERNAANAEKFWDFGFLSSKYDSSHVHKAQRESIEAPSGKGKSLPSSARPVQQPDAETTIVGTPSGKGQTITTTKKDNKQRQHKPNPSDFCGPV